MHDLVILVLASSLTSVAVTFGHITARIYLRRQRRRKHRIRISKAEIDTIRHKTTT